MNDFKTDLEVGQTAEFILASMLIMNGITGVTFNTSTSIEQLKKYDIMYYNVNASQPVLIEVKNDLRAEYTGYFAIEAKYKGNDSGILKTTANYWAILSDDKFYIISTKELKTLIDSNIYRCIEVNNGTTFIHLVKVIDVATNGIVISAKDYINN